MNNHIGVIDIGSNTVRLVVYDGNTRAPVPMFNERTFCALGRDLAASRQIGEAATEDALRTITRFCRLARAMGVDRLSLIGTAAVRDAENGRAFCESVHARCGEPVVVLSGEDEARLSALGVISGVPSADGIMGDLGGGSLELVDIERGRVRRQTTLPLGILRLSGLHAANRNAAISAIESRLAEVDWLSAGEGRSFYPVGGAWRAIARLHMDFERHPLHVIDGYMMTAAEMEEITNLVASFSQRSLQRVTGIARRRRETLPLACDLMRAVVAASGARRVVFSAQGLREGYLYDSLPRGAQKIDPVIDAAEALADRQARFGPMGRALYDWIDPLFKGRHEGRRRLRLVACHLADIAWREHPDYRAVQAMLRILRFPFLGLDHGERAFLAYVAFVRYGGDMTLPDVAPVLGLMSRRNVRRAELIGTALRLAYRVSGGARDVLQRSELLVIQNRLSLRLPEDGSSPLDEAVERQFASLVAVSRMRRGRIIAP